MNPKAAMALLLVCLCAFFEGGTAAVAKPAPAREGPPVLASIDVRVEGRLPVQIVLKTAVAQRGNVRFVIRGEPQFGKIRQIKQLTGNSVEVEYVPPADRSIVSDSFLFAGFNGEGFSSDSKARIQIVDLGPRLSVPLALDFPSTQVGQSALMPLEVRNSGDQRVEGRITVPVPWEIEKGADQYSIAPGETKTVGIFFRPFKVGWSQGSVRLSSGSSSTDEAGGGASSIDDSGGGVSATVQVRASASDWVEVAKDPVVFAWGQSRQQSGELLLSNPGGKPLELTLQASPALEHEAKVQIEAGTLVAVPLRWRENSIPEGWGTLLLSSKSGLRRVVVWRLDAILSGLGPAFVLADEKVGCTARRTFTNTGGIRGSWTFRCTPPFSLGDAEPLPKPPPSPAVASARASAKSVEAHPAREGWTFDHNQNRYVSNNGASKTASARKDEPKAAPAVVHNAAGASEITKSLLPGESFVLYIGLGGPPSGAGGTLFVSGPGLNHQEALLVKGEGAAGRGKAKLPNALGATARKLTAPPAEALVSGTPLPPPADSPLGRAAGALGVANLPSILTKKIAEPAPPPPPPPDFLRKAFLPGLFLPGFRVKDVTSTSATIVFPAEKGVTPEDLVVLYLTLHPVENAEPDVEWVPFGAAYRKGRRVGQNIEIRLGNLPPGFISQIMLLGPASADGWRDPLVVMPIQTHPSGGLMTAKAPWLWLVFVTALGGVYFQRRRAK